MTKRLPKDVFDIDFHKFVMQCIKDVPPQMQDMVRGDFEGFVSQDVPMMVMDKLYQNGTFKNLPEEERITANLTMLSDVLPV